MCFEFTDIVYTNRRIVLFYHSSDVRLKPRRLTLSYIYTNCRDLITKIIAHIFNCHKQTALYSNDVVDRFYKNCKILLFIV